MRVIYKYPLMLGQTCIVLPPDSQILSFQAQAGMPVMWAMIPLGPAPTVRKNFFLAATGQPFLRKAWDQYRATIQLAEGRVVHVFEEGAEV